jgi:YVTN family beta-propeller protein
MKRFLLWHLALAGACGVGPLRASEMLYVSNERSGDVSVIDLTGRTVVRTFPVGKRPRGIHLSTDGATLYVAVSGSPRLGPGADPDRAHAPAPDRAADGIAVVDAASGRLQRKIDVGSDPEEFDLSPDGRRVIVANEDEGTASAWDIASGRMIFRTPIAAEPEGVRCHPTRGEVYVTCEGTGEVFVLDALRGGILARLALGGRPRTVSFSPDGAQAFIPLEGQAQVDTINAATHAVIGHVAITDHDALPMGSAVSPDGRELYVTTGRGNTVAVIDVARSVATGSIPVGRRPWGIARSRDGATLYTANGGTNDISVIDVATRREITRIKVGEGPWGLAMSGPAASAAPPAAKAARVAPDR